MTTVSSLQRKCTGILIDWFNLFNLFDKHVCFLRCSECLTKHYCSRNCLLKDSEEKHSKFCKKGAEERKVKEDAKARVEVALKRLEVGLENSVKLEAEQQVKTMIVEVKELCEKQVGKDKRKSAGGNLKKGSRKK